jgi:hypothetical protein
VKRGRAATLKEASALLEEHLPERPYARYAGLSSTGKLLFSQVWACFEGVEECSNLGWRAMIPINIARIRRYPKESADFVIDKLDDAARNDGVFFWEI